MCHLADVPRPAGGYLSLCSHRVSALTLYARMYVPRRETVRGDQTVSEMVVEILAYQAKALVERTGQPFEDMLVAILRTDAARQLEELATGPHRHQKARDWHANLTREGIEHSYHLWLEDYVEWLEDEEARAEYHAFLEQVLGLHKGLITALAF